MQKSPTTCRAFTAFSVCLHKAKGRRQPIILPDICQIDNYMFVALLYTCSMQSAMNIKNHLKPIRPKRIKRSGKTKGQAQSRRLYRRLQGGVRPEKAERKNHRQADKESAFRRFKKSETANPIITTTSAARKALLTPAVTASRIFSLVGSENCKR